MTILHLSDMQLDAPRPADPDAGIELALRRLCDDLDRLALDNGIRPDLVALTGDLTASGMKREFEQLAVFGDGLRAHLALEPDRLLVIPGNRDVNHSLCHAYFLRCAADGDAPRPPYWPKWEPFVAAFGRLYRDVDRYRLTELEPWTLFEVPSLRVVVAGLNSTIRDSHCATDHGGFLGEPQLRWFADRLAEYERAGWLRIGMVHHNALRGGPDEDDGLIDTDDLREIFGDRLHVLLHGHAHRGQIDMLGPALPVISTGCTAATHEQCAGLRQPRGEHGRYQLVRITRGGLWCGAREYAHARRRWIGDNRLSAHGDRWWSSLAVPWPHTDATFPAPASELRHRGPAVEVGSEPDDTPEGLQVVARRRDDDLLDDVISWCRIRGEDRLAAVTRVSHRGPWGDHAKVHDRERGIGLLGAYRGDLTTEVLERWIADVHEPFRGRGQAVSTLVVAATAIDPALRSVAQARGVEIERMIDYQRVLDTVGYGDKLRERLARDRKYPSQYYLEQRMTVWSPVHGSSEKVDRAADWLTTRLLEREGAFVLVLGAAGVGKTFLLREVARRLGSQQAITPILVELRDLDRARTIEELAATQFTRFGVPWHPRAFRRDLEEGRLVLMFDGFDELALRVRSAAIPAHFERIYAAAVDHARIAVTSRTEHFLSSGEVADLMTPSSAGTTPLGGLLERVQRRHVLEVHPFERDDVAAYLRRRLGDAAGEARLTRLARVHDLVGLARNPRMLSFLVDIPEDKLAHAAGLGGSITSDALYRIVVDDAWLTAEAERLSPPGAAAGPGAAALRDAAMHLALHLWRDPRSSLQIEEVGAHAGSLLARMCDQDPDWISHTARARTLLIRDDRGRIAFIHQTVVEWLVASCVAAEITGDSCTTHLDVGRLNTFMIDLLRERLGDDALARWAEARLAAPTTGAAAENARDVMRRLEREATTPAIHRDQDLRGQELAGQSLHRAILDRSDLTGARLVGRDLTGASLVAAQLAYADFSDACLCGADLSHANLAFARFHRTNLDGACLTAAQLTGASFLETRGVPVLDDASAVGVALAVPSPLDRMYGRALSGSCRVAINRDGTVLVSGHDDGTIRLWDCGAGQPVRLLTGHGARVFCVAFAPDGKTVASGAEDATVRLWNVADGNEQIRLAGHRGSVRCVAFAPDGKTVASGADDTTVRLWRAADGSERARLAGHRGSVWSVAFSPDGSTVASGADDATVRLRSAVDGTERARLVGHGAGVRSVAFSPDGSTVASGAEDATVRLWSAVDGREQVRLVGHDRGVRSVAFSPDGRTVASGGDDTTVRLWSATDGSERAILTGHRGSVASVAFSADGKTVASSADDATVRLWSTADGSERFRLDGHGGTVWTVAVSPDGATLASAGDDAIVRLWNVMDGSEQRRLAGASGAVWTVAFSPDGATLASGGDDAIVRLWNAMDGSERRRLAGHSGRVCSVAFSPDGSVVASGAADTTVRLWSAVDGSKRRVLTGHRGCVRTVAFSPDGRTVASGADDATVRLRSLDDGDGVVLTGHRRRIFSVAFSPDGKTVATGAADATVRLWSTEGSERARLVGHRGSVCSVAFSPDGRTVASGAVDGTLRLWSAADGGERARLVGHDGCVRSVAFSPDGETLTSSSDDATIRLWDVATGRCLVTLYGTAGGAVVVRHDGRYRVRGDLAGQFWHVIGLHRYDVGELDALVPALRLADDEPIR